VLRQRDDTAPLCACRKARVPGARQQAITETCALSEPGTSQSSARKASSQRTTHTAQSTHIPGGLRARQVRSIAPLEATTTSSPPHDLDIYAPYVPLDDTLTIPAAVSRLSAAMMDNGRYTVPTSTKSPFMPQPANLGRPAAPYGYPPKMPGPTRSRVSNVGSPPRASPAP
jgi:hypothetical protein